MTGFYQYFLDHVYHNQSIQYDYRMRNFYFRKYLINKLCKEDENFEMNLSQISNFVLPSIRKPQHCILSKEEYYVAWDMYTKTKYICYRELMCIDFDVGKESFETKQEIVEYVNQHPLLSSLPTMQVETRNGYHVFLLDKPRQHNDPKMIQFMLQFNVDPYYAVYCYLRGYSIRVNPKNYKQDNIVFEVKISHKDKADTHLLQLASQQFRHIDFSYTSEMS